MLHALWCTLQVSEMVYEESVRCGKVLGIAVPVPPAEVADGEACRVYVKFSSSSEAAKCKEMMDGRLFDSNTVRLLLAWAGDSGRPADTAEAGCMQPVVSMQG